MRSLLLYTRAGCHLCEDMFTHLQRLRKQRDFSLELIEVDHQPAIQASYGARVPVLETADGECLSEYFLDEVGLLNYLDGG